jgi:hypothetical protein
MRIHTYAAMTIAALMAASPAQAQKFAEYDDNCGSAPFGPTITTDVTIPDAKVDELRKDVLAFLKASDQYQDCITKIMEGGPTFKKEDPMEKKMQMAKRFEAQGIKLIDDNQSEKERAGNDFNALVEARKKAGKP